MSFRTSQILGIRFFDGTAKEAVRCAASGGLVVAPSGTCFERFLEDEAYREAILGADLVLPDSGLMVTLWRLSRHQIERISGLAYLRELLLLPDFAAQTQWVLPNERSFKKLLAWSEANGFGIRAESCYIAPIYGQRVADAKLVALTKTNQPRHIVIGLGAGTQEKLGAYLRAHAGYRPAIHCIGGALGFITGDQIAIPRWADRLYCGWLFRLVSQPRVFIPRLWRARGLPWLILKHGAALPPVRTTVQ